MSGAAAGASSALALERQQRVFDQAPGFIAILRGPEHVFEFVNRAYVKLAGERDYIGRTAREVLPEVADQGFFERLDEVYASGERYVAHGVPVRLARTRDEQLEQRFVDFIYAAILDGEGRAEGIFVEGHDVTEVYETNAALRQTQRRQALLIELNDRFRELEDSAEISYAAAELLGRALNVSRAGYGTINTADETITIERDWNAPGIQSLAGTLHFRDYGSYIEDLKRGETVIFSDAEKDPRTRDNAAALKAISAQSVVNMPVTEQGGFVALLYLNHESAREWTDEEVALIHDVAERTRTAVERRRAEQEARDLASRLRLALDAGRMAVWGVRADGQVEATPEFNRLVGLERDAQPTLEELQARYDVGELERVQKLGMEAAARGDDHIEFEYRHLMPDDEPRWLLVRAEFLKDEQGRPDGALGVVLDVTDRKNAEERERRILGDLRESESRLRIAQEAGQIGAFELLPTQGRILVTPQFCRLWGVPVQAEFETRRLLDLIHPDDAAQIATGQTIIDNAVLEYVEYRIRKADTGEDRWIARRGEVLADESGRTRYLGVTYDITDRKRAELALTRLNETLEAQVAARTEERDRMWRLSAELMLVADFEANIVALNPAWTAVLGYAASELVGRKFMELVHPDDVEPTLREVGRLSDGATTFAFENRYRHKDGSWRCLAWTAVPDAGFIHALARDVTQERAAAEALRRTEEALRQSQKMEAVGQLTGGIAHDFNNMLAIVIGSLDLAKRRLERGQATEPYLDNAREGALRAASLTQRLLAFSRQQPLSPKVTNLNRLVSDMSELLRRTLGERIDLETVLAGGLWPVNADPHQLESALVNLAVNARDAMSDGGQLTIETANTHLDEAYVRDQLGVNPGQYVMIAVTDRGTGMPPDVLARVFDPFFTTKPVGKGTGLGLSMVYGFIKQSGGHVGIYSEPGVGTTVKIYLPRHLGQVEDEGSGPAVSLADSGGAEVILVVEDEESVRQMSVAALKDLGYIVYQASGGEEALRVIDTLTRLDLLFTDVVMPGMTGRQLAAQVQERAPHVKVLYTTGYTRNAVVHNGVLDPGVEFLPKPFRIGDLAAKVRAILDRAAMT